jgi:hypothetical protein
MIRIGKLSLNIAAPLSVMALAFCCLQPQSARADSLTLSAEYIGNYPGGSSYSCPPGATSCGSFAQATGSLSSGTSGVLAQFLSDPLPFVTGQLNVEAVSTASTAYDFTSSQSTGTAVFTFTVTGQASTSFITGSGQPNICSAGGCEAAAYFTIPTDEAFVGASTTATDYTLAYLNGISNTVSGSTTIQVSAPITGNTADLSFVLSAHAFCPSLTVAQHIAGDNCIASADYEDPLTITSVSIYDANGDLIPNATLISDSGYIPPAAVPEPRSILLFASAALFAGVGVWKRPHSAVAPPS